MEYFHEQQSHFKKTVFPCSAQAQAQLEAELVLILKYPEKLARKHILGIHTSYNPSSNLKHIPNRVNKLQMAGSSFKA